ncbi:hypothetical protein DKK70_04460 [Gilliamella apicola]|uniref:Uncharacterized protein n=1 Tax=Gilliamella apicola TaxID=1196095 RepID=A0A2V4EAI1_9GAMM|nr:dimethylsulfonioproprionate lyase family protein [Gilliamella apicola]PXZ07916.1 hypothetical protein DKK70_04460 [Gilliamella apicola]
MKGYLFLLSMSFFSFESFANLPNFIIDKDIKNAKFVCLNPPTNYTQEEKKEINKLWKETVIYLQTFANALITPQTENCINSDEAIIQTGTTSENIPKKQCIMDNIDVKKMVKHIYTIIYNQDEAFKCFNPQKNVEGLYSPSEELNKKSSVAQWLNRPLLKMYYQNDENMEIQKAGMKYADKFNSFVTDSAIKMPSNFERDISAKSLPNLWASSGWVPMYSNNTERNVNAGDLTFRASYAYAEIMGHWGLLQIDSINGEPVGAEIGMTVQAGNTFYPFHHHNTNEIYYTIREPSCTKGISQFVVPYDDNLFTEKSSINNKLIVELSGSKTTNINNYWAATTPKHDSLLYIPRNAIHAFNLTKTNCGNNYAHVTIWARTDAHEKNSDYGTTNICQLQDKTLAKENINKAQADIVCHINR